jgi:predicted nucleotidyltransferase
MYGLSAKTLEEITAAFMQCPNIEKVMLYGSRAKGNYRNGSDIDMTLMGEGLTLENSVYPLMEIFDESSLPYSFDISIFKDIENESLVEHIERVGKVLYEKV